MAINRINSRPLPCPFSIIIDGQEKAPYRFDNIHADARYHSRLLTIQTERNHLTTGDYTIKEMWGLVLVERKSLRDLFRTLGSKQTRNRFEREHFRLSAAPAAAIVVEADWQTILARPPKESRLLPKVVLRTAISWQMRYRVPWYCVPGRRAGEIVTFRILEKFWKEETLRRKEVKHGKTVSSRRS